jgi:hypothetical protein
MTGDADLDRNKGCGPCTGGCLIVGSRGDELWCVRCGLEFASEAEWRARAQYDSPADLPKEQQ